MLDKKKKPINFDDPKEGERIFLSSNKTVFRSPSLDFLDTSAEHVTEDMMLDYLAQIISAIYVSKLNGDTQETGSDILQSFDEGTG